MNFKEFWKILQVELRHDKEFLTLKQNKKFKAYLERKVNGELAVRVIPESGKPRGQISYNEFEGIWDNSKGLTHEMRFVNRHRRLESYQTKKGEVGKSKNVSYIITLIEHVVKSEKIE